MTFGPPALFIRKGGFSTVSWPMAMIRSARVDRLVDIVALRERGGAHVEVGAAGDGALAHLRVEEGQSGARARRPRALRPAAAGCRPRRSSPAAAWRPGSSRRPVERGGLGDRALQRVDAGSAEASSTSSAATSSGSSRCTGPGRSSIATRKASRTVEGMLAALTIWRVILVSGFIEATISTIWKRACLALMIGFWPVIMIIGMAPRCA